jgi:hypothetical protein
MKCTWVGCDNKASCLQESKDGEIWANLCEEHEAKQVKDIKEGNIKAMLSNWVKASGGSDKLAKRVLGL